MSAGEESDPSNTKLKYKRRIPSMEYQKDTLYGVAFKREEHFLVLHARDPYLILHRGDPSLVFEGSLLVFDRSDSSPVLN